jgi:hypothetical protein
LNGNHQEEPLLVAKDPVAEVGLVVDVVLGPLQPNGLLPFTHAVGVSNTPEKQRENPGKRKAHQKLMEV